MERCHRESRFVVHCSFRDIIRLTELLTLLAIDRVHRIGQEKTVYVKHFIVSLIQPSAAHCYFIQSVSHDGPCAHPCLVCYCCPLRIGRRHDRRSHPPDSEAQDSARKGSVPRDSGKGQGSRPGEHREFETHVRRLSANTLPLYRL